MSPNQAKQGGWDGRLMLEKGPEMATARTLRCPNCGYMALENEGWAMNPRQGYQICPRCRRRGLDVIPLNFPVDMASARLKEIYDRYE